MRKTLFLILFILWSSLLLKISLAGENSDVSKKFRVKVQGIPFDQYKKFAFFTDEDTCKNSMERGEDWSPFTLADIEELRLPYSSWAKVIIKNDNVTDCQKGRIEGGFLVFNFVPFSFGEKRKIILFSSSDLLGSQGRGCAIQHSMIDLLSFVKNNNIREPISVVSIHSDSLQEEIVKAEDLKDLVIEGNDVLPKDSIYGRVKGNLPFASNGIAYDSLRILNTTEKMYKNKIESVLFFTSVMENPRIVAGTSVGEIGTILLWILKGVKIQVVTDENCNFWTQHKEFQIPCEALGKRPDQNKLTSFIKEFLFRK